MTLEEWANRYIVQERPIGTVLDDDVIHAQALAAANYYGGYQGLAAHAALDAVPPIDADTDITAGEWAIIRRLFVLYTERENAMYLESSRALGLDVYGRATSEVSADIAAFEAEIPHAAFYSPIITV